MNQNLSRIQSLGADVLAIHVECNEAGTRQSVTRNRLEFPLANDERLRVVTKFSPTSTYVIDRQGVIRARWLNAIHARVSAAEIVKALEQLPK